MTITSAQMELRQRREATITEHIEAENHHDPNRAVATFSSYRASYDVPSMGEAGATRRRQRRSSDVGRHHNGLPRHPYRTWTTVSWR